MRSPKIRKIASKVFCSSVLASTAWACAPGLQAPNDLGLLALLGGTTGAFISAGPTHSVGGSVLGLSSSSLVLTLNDSQDLNVSADGDFVFSTNIAEGSAYTVSVKNQPTSPAEYCSVSAGSGTIAGAVTGVQVTCFQLPDTGQSTCYGSGGGIIACGSFPTGQDGDFTSTPAAILNAPTSDGTLRERSSMLLWQRCSFGGNWNGSGCNGSATTTSRAMAASHCANLSLGGHAWRLPTIRELLMLPDYGLSGPALVTVQFPGTPPGVNSRYFSSNLNSLNTNRTWVLNFFRGNTDDQPNTNAAYVRCVSGPTVPDNQFVSRENGVVHDQSTNLTWTKCSLTGFGPPGIMDASTNCTATPNNDNWDSSVTACNSLNFAGRTDWRLPSVRELATLLDFASAAPPLVNTEVFPNTGATSYWASTTSTQTDTEAWTVDFSNFRIMPAIKGGNFRARCVATGP